MTAPLITILAWCAVAATDAREDPHLSKAFREAIAAALPDAREVRAVPAPLSRGFFYLLSGIDAEGRAFRGHASGRPLAIDFIDSAVAEADVPAPLRGLARLAWPGDEPPAGAIDLRNSPGKPAVYQFRTTEGSPWAPVGVGVDGTVFLEERRTFVGPRFAALRFGSSVVIEPISRAVPGHRHIEESGPDRYTGIDAEGRRFALAIEARDKSFPSWTLATAIDASDVPGRIDAMARVIAGAKGWTPNHVRRITRSDSPGLLTFEFLDGPEADEARVVLTVVQAAIWD